VLVAPHCARIASPFAHAITDDAGAIGYVAGAELLRTLWNFTDERCQATTDALPLSVLPSITDIAKGANDDASCALDNVIAIVPQTLDIEADLGGDLIGT